MKKLFTSILAAVLAVCSAAPVSANAIARFGDRSSEINEMLDHYPYKLEDPSSYEWCLEAVSNTSTYINEEATGVLVIGQRGSYLVIGCTSDTNEAVFMTAVRNAAENHMESPRITGFNRCCVIYDVSDEAAKAIWNEVKDAQGLRSFEYTPQYWTYNNIGFFGNVLTYDDGTFRIFDKQYSDLESFTEENGLKIKQVEIPVGDEIHPAYEVVPADDTKLNAAEMAELSVRIEKEVGIYAYGSSPTTVSDNGETVELVGAVNGDANADSRLSLNDAVAVLQYISLPQKYPLTAQGRFNADCDGKDGISGGDALWIQQQDAEKSTG